jgi:hypothetical protein
MRKYGKEAFKIELLEECETRDLAFEHERDFILSFESYVTLKKEYNVTWGKGGHTRGMTGRHHSEETKLKMSLAQRGKSRHDVAARAKMSQQRRGVPQGPYKTSKLIEQVNEKGEVIATFQTQRVPSLWEKDELTFRSVVSEEEKQHVGTSGDTLVHPDARE